MRVSPCLPILSAILLFHETNYIILRVEDTHAVSGEIHEQLPIDSDSDHRVPRSNKE